MIRKGQRRAYFVIRSFIFSVCALIGLNQGRAGILIAQHAQPMQVSVEEAIRILRAFESRYRTIQYEARNYPLRVLHGQNPDRDVQFEALDQKSTSIWRVVIDRERQLYYVSETLRCVPQGLPKPVEVRAFEAFNGEEYRGYNYDDPAAAIPVNGPPRVEPLQMGFIAAQRLATGLNLSSHLLAFPPNESYMDSEPQPLSQWLQNKANVGELIGIFREQPGVWRLR